jgi:hypothetical protein
MGGHPLASRCRQTQPMTATVVLSIIASASLLATFAAWRALRQTRRRLDELSQSYWQLRYELGELRVQLQGRTPPPSGGPGAPAAPRTPSGEGFVPLTSLKR